MSDRKYESDMTKKEKRQLRKEQLLSTHGKDRIGYIWSYYKLEMMFGVIIVVFAIFFVNWLLNLRYDQILYVGVVNYGGCDGEKMAADYREYIDNDDKFDMVDVDTTLAISSEGEMGDFTGTARLVSQMSSSLIDVIILDQYAFDFYKDTEVFMDLNEFFADADGEYSAFIAEEIGLDLTGNEVLASYGIDTSEPVYLMVSDQSKNKEYVKEFVDFLFSEN